ncbi:MarR family transcriptional regulator [Flavobacterium sp. NST-5]|uniref:MarR family transcriptional regulator n=1 Tax=Flavobacterium ichthyis TaxID=2698827 RepID=A0ABW9Z5L3_9FLAO|nr:MarR family transcriptional regulator [Flavobacterium ichthyis]NBL64135.1 MarR family transcriptional regulator [Flavobacterium ichthyis]
MRIEEILKTNSPLLPSKKIILNLIYNQNLINEKFNDVLKPHDLSMEQFNVLRILKGQKDKPAHMSLIQERMLTKTSNTTRLVDKLLNKGLVNRQTCKENRRKMEISITPLGKETLETISPLIENVESLFAQNLTPAEVEMLNFLLEKYRNN